MDLNIHLNVANGLGNVVNQLFGLIQFMFPCSIEVVPSMEGAEQA